MTLSTGCVALPFATPPMTVSVSPAAAVGTSLPPAAAEDDEPARGLVVGRAAIRPLGAIADLEERTFGASLGYVAEIPPHEELVAHARHGGFVGLTHYPWSQQLGSGRWFTRLGITAMPEFVALEDGSEIGGGATFSTDLELFSYAVGGFSAASAEGGMVGGALGEGGIGVTLSSSVRGLGRLRYWVFGLGMLVRLPATGGIAVVPAWELLR